MTNEKKFEEIMWEAASLGIYDDVYNEIEKIGFEHPNRNVIDLLSIISDIYETIKNKKINEVLNNNP